MRSIGDIAAHGLRQSPNDGKAQPGPAELPRGRAIGLDEWLEEACELFPAHPDPGVGHGERRARVVAVNRIVPARTSTPPRSVNLMALLNKLNRFAEPGWDPQSRRPVSRRRFPQRGKVAWRAPAAGTCPRPHR